MSSIGQADDRTASTESLQLIREAFQAHLQFSVPGQSVEIKSGISLQPAAVTAEMLEQVNKTVPMPAQAQRRISIRFPLHMAGADVYRISYIDYEVRLDN